MRLVIEREGGFDIVETDDLQEIAVLNTGVRLDYRDGSRLDIQREDHAASVALATAIAVRCGELVEPLAVQEELEADGLEDAADDDAMGAVMAGRKRKNSTPPRR
jgi:hypothetical protein